MAEIISRKNHKHSLRVDLTPMVDLGFLLITFFIITTSMQQPNVMKLNVPADGINTNYGESKTLNMILLKDNKVKFYNGTDSTKTSTFQFNDINKIRGYINYKQNTLNKIYGNKNELLLLIKPTKNAKYKNVVDALDEVKINTINKYMIVKPSLFEENL